jgi:hypothetical protein
VSARESDNARGSWPVGIQESGIAPSRWIIMLISRMFDGLETEAFFNVCRCVARTACGFKV